jgi:hypothetical protein
MGRGLLVFTDWWLGNLNYIKHLHQILPFLCKIQDRGGMKKIVLFLFLTVIAVSGCDKLSTEKKAESIDDQMKMAKIEFDNKNFGKTVEITIKITQTDPKNADAYYLESQAQSIMGDVKSALNSLEDAFKNGFKDFSGVMTNSNLDAVKQTPEFQVLIQRYDPSAAAKASISDKEIKAGDTSITEVDGQQVIKAGDIEIKLPQ